MAAKVFEKLSCYRLPLLALLVAVLYLPSLKNGYVGWDDALIQSNQTIRSLSVENLLEMFVPPAGRMASYQPLRSLVYALVYAVNGPRPFGFLLLNIFLYIVNILLFYKVVKYLLQANGRQGSGQRAENIALAASAVFPCTLYPPNFSTLWGVRPRCPRRGIPDFTIARAASRDSVPPSSFTESQPASSIKRLAFFTACSGVS